MSEVSQPNEQLTEKIQRALDAVPTEESLNYFIRNSPDWLRALLEKIEGMQWKIDAQERVQRVGDDHYREAVKPIKHLWPLENTPGIVQIVEMLQQTREALEKCVEIYSDKLIEDSEAVNAMGRIILSALFGGKSHD